MAETGVTVVPRRRWGQWSVTKPATIEINGEPVGKAHWGTAAFFRTRPGRQRVTVSYPFLWKERTDEATVELDLAPGQRVVVEYRSSWLASPRGTVAVS